jgi:hypothetical protein
VRRDTDKLQHFSGLSYTTTWLFCYLPGINLALIINQRYLYKGRAHVSASLQKNYRAYLMPDDWNHRGAADESTNPVIAILRWSTSGNARLSM